MRGFEINACLKSVRYATKYIIHSIVVVTSNNPSPNNTDDRFIASKPFREMTYRIMYHLLSDQKKGSLYLSVFDIASS